jgi:hypothetical protein
MNILMVLPSPYSSTDQLEVGSKATLAETFPVIILLNVRQLHREPGVSEPDVPRSLRF